MKRTLTYAHVILFLLVVCLSGCHKKISVLPPADRLPPRAHLIIDGEQNLSPPVVKLMRLTKIQPTTKLAQAVVSTQEHWLRRAAPERAHITEAHQDLTALMMRQFVSLGLTNEILPTQKEYDYAILLGAMYETVERRLNFLEEAFRRGIKFKTIALLGSERPLDPHHELKLMAQTKKFSVLPTTEMGMMDALFAKSFIIERYPNISIVKVNSPMKKDIRGTVTRANTADTVIDFRKLNLTPGTALVISSQPYALRQDLVVQRLLGTAWKIETVAPKATELATGVYLDELARTLYELKIFLDSVKVL